ncbi:transcription-repair coupling factor domain protein, partial [Chlamydia psittaci 84-8471/1]
TLNRESFQAVYIPSHKKFGDRSFITLPIGLF